MKFLLVCFSFVLASNAWAQERIVSGKVTAQEDGSSLPGVNVVLKGTTNGVVTNTDGNYQLSVPESGGTLVLSFIGFTTQEINIGQRAVIDVQMAMDVQQLTEVVVTAQGIERDRKALGYASTTVSGTDLANKPEPDLGRALQGRSPGVQILNSSGIAGSGSKINIRGISSVSGNTQPLWIVDGVPINTGNNDSNKDYVDGQIGPNRFFDLDPNNVESINILRGLSATTLYGSLGRNGVILVTTKTGSHNKNARKFEASLSQSLFITEAIVPELQNKWGNGYDGDYGEFFSNWGNVFDGTSPVTSGGGTPPHPFYEWRAKFPEFPEFAQASGYIPKAYPNNVKDMFRKGTSSNTSLSLGGSSEFGNLNFAYSHLDEKGYIEHNNVQRDNFSLGGNANLTRKLKMSSTFNYVRSYFESPPSAPGKGNTSLGGPSIFANLFFTPRNLDITNWPYQDPVTGGNVYYRNTNGIANPRWILNNTIQTSLTNRFFSNIGFTYDVADWLKVSYRLGLDTYGERQTYEIQKGSVGNDLSIIGTGIYRTVNVNNTILDHSFIASIQKKLNPDLELNGILGYNARTDEFVQSGLESSQQIVFGLMEHRNFASTTSRDFRGNNLNSQSRRSWYGAYFDAGLGYKNFLYLNVTGRNDWSTTLEKENNSLFYPGASASFIPTAAFPNFGAGVLDFLKIRAGYGTSANFPDPYNTRATLPIVASYQIDALGNVPVQGQNRRLANSNLRPELQRELEFGLEGQLLENLVKLDLSYYNRSAKDQILARQLDPSTGFTETLINAGEITNKGVELGLTVTPVRKAVVWNLRGNFTKNVSKVVSLPEGSKEILISGSSDLGNFAIEGQPFNVIKGQKVQRNDAGQRLTDGDNNYVLTPDLYIVGNPNPDWIGSLFSDVTWKGITFAFQINYVQGGDMFSATAAALIGRGVSKDLENFDPGLPLILPGVKESDGSVNDGILTTAGVFYTQSILEKNPQDRAIYDATRIRLQEISLSYNIPQTLISKLSIRSANISLVGNNLWFRSLNTPKYTHVDFDRTPFGTGNGAGFEFLGGPSARRYGVNLRLTF